MSEARWFSHLTTKPRLSSCLPTKITLNHAFLGLLLQGGLWSWNDTRILPLGFLIVCLMRKSRFFDNDCVIHRIPKQTLNILE